MLPQDPMILLSYLNTKLRDFYPTLDALCDDLQIDGGEVSRRPVSYTHLTLPTNSLV